MARWWEKTGGSLAQGALPAAALPGSGPGRGGGRPAPDARHHLDQAVRRLRGRGGPAPAARRRADRPTAQHHPIQFRRGPVVAAQDRRRHSADRLPARSRIEAGRSDRARRRHGRAAAGPAQGGERAARLQDRLPGPRAPAPAGGRRGRLADRHHRQGAGRPRRPDGPGPQSPLAAGQDTRVAGVYRDLAKEPPALYWGTLLPDIYPSPVTETEPPPLLLANARDTQAALSAPVETISLSGRALALGLAAAVGFYMVRRRRSEFMVLAAQGIGARLGVRAVAEAVLPMALGGLAGWELALVLGRHFDPSPVVSATVVRAAGLQAGLTLGAGLLLIGVATLLVSRHETRERVGRVPGVLTWPLLWEALALLLAGAALYEVTMDVTEQLVLAARLRGMPRRRAAGDLDELLGRLGIGDRRHHLPRQLSGGEQQRLAFARALIGDPPLVVADEPTAELDAASGQALLATVEALTARGTAFVVATHDQAVVRVADRTMYLRHGAMEAEATRPQAEASERKRLSVIDDAGRVQLPPEALKLFPGRRARIPRRAAADCAGQGHGDGAARAAGRRAERAPGRRLGRHGVPGVPLDRRQGHELPGGHPQPGVPETGRSCRHHARRPAGREPVTRGAAEVRAPRHDLKR